MHLKLVGLSHRFPGQEPLFSKVTASWKPGDLVAVTGPSGSGKSTLLSIIAGWLTPTQGSVDIPADASIAWVFQNPHGVGRRSALDHVVLPLLARGLSRRDAQRQAHDILTRFHLNDVATRPFAALSGGEGQRLMLARATARQASLILVDEPTAQLDHASATSVVAVLNGLAAQGALVVIATHDTRVQEQCPIHLDLGNYCETT